MYRTGCCEFFELLDTSKMGIPGVQVRWEDVDLWTVIFLNIFIPVFALLVAHWERDQHRLSALFGSPRRAVVAFGSLLILLTLQSNLRFNALVRSQAHWFMLQDNRILWSGYCMLITGTVLIYKAVRSLGFYATFYGLYFGIGAKQKSDAFPYTLLDHPMYFGSVLDLCGLSLVFASQAGLFVSVVTGVMFYIVARHERDFLEACCRVSSEPKKES